MNNQNNKIDTLIKEEKYEEALKELLTLEGNYLKKTQCLYEMDKHNELVSFFEGISDKIENDYFEILGYYILSLLELEEFDKAISLLNEELSMPYIQEPYDSVLNQLYDDVVTRKALYLSQSGLDRPHLHEHDVHDVLLHGDDFFQQLSVINNLDQFNIRNILEDLESFLENSKKSSILKTFVLETLIKQQISNVVVVVKNGYEYEYLPLANQLVFENHNYLATRNILEDHLAKNPSFLEMAIDVLDTLVYIIYPEVIDEDETRLYAAAIEYYVYSLNMEDVEEDFYQIYEFDEKLIEQEVDNIAKLLESEEGNTNSL